VSIDLYVNPQEDSQVNPQRDSLRYARLPWSIITSRKLKRLDGYVYAVLAASVWQGNYASVGTRYIAEILHTTQRRVVESLARLQKEGEIKAADRRRGQRAGYVLPSPVFASKQGKIDEVVTAPSGRRHLVSVRATA
jgi:hypothetical protein